MQIRPEQLPQHLNKLRSLYTVYGDEILLVQEAVDAIRAQARAHGHTERQVHTVAGAHFDWSSLIGASQTMSLFADKQVVEIRIPSGKPGKDGSDALQLYCTHVCDDVVSIISLPKLDKTQQSSAWFTALDAAGVTVRVDAVERAALPTWIAKRLAQQGQRVPGDEAGQRSLVFFADCVEGNLMAAHQEIQKLGLLYPPGELQAPQIEAAVLNVARYDVFKLGEAVLAGQLSRALRMLRGLQSEGVAAVLVHWTLANDIVGLKRAFDALQSGKPLPLALREARIWGPKERLLERALPQLTHSVVAELLDAAQICDGIVKGLKHPEWPLDMWHSLARLVTMICAGVAKQLGKKGDLVMMRQPVHFL
jgi:DNA polymerase III subunit delta